jgi:hypothetical protein
MRHGYFSQLAARPIKSLPVNTLESPECFARSATAFGKSDKTEIFPGALERQCDETERAPAEDQVVPRRSYPIEEKTLRTGGGCSGVADDGHEARLLSDAWGTAPTDSRFVIRLLSIASACIHQRSGATPLRRNQV